MNILKSKKIGILGLGLHGGGVSSTYIAHKFLADKIYIIDSANKEKLEKMLQKLANNTIQYQILPYEKESIQKCDVIIKNPAVRRNAEILKYAQKIETDISLYYSYQQTPSIVITGSKGKSSVSTAIYNTLATRTKKIVALTGNITYSPLNVILNDEIPDLLVVELSSFQIGDLGLVKNPPFDNFSTAILTNIMHDHLNYYSNMQEYVADKLLLFKHLKETQNAILPYDNNNTYIYHLKNNTILHGEIYDNNFSLTISQCYFHSLTSLPQEFQGVWIEDDIIYIREFTNSPQKKLIELCDIPSHIPKQNILILLTYLLAENRLDIIPDSKEEWMKIFQIAHRKEYITCIQRRTFINDSAATIPPAIQLELYKNPVRLICGGTDKNLDPQEFISAISNAKKIYLLEGSFTQKCLPLIQQNNLHFAGPYNSLEEAVYNSYQESQENEYIVLSPGCASFEMFLHEFDRGDQFKNIIQTLPENLV